MTEETEAPVVGLLSCVVDEPESQTRAFEQQRRQRDSMMAQDYCELIADLIDAQGEARAVDISRRLGVAHATVVNTIGRLQRDGYVLQQPYRSIFLTEAGRALALECRRRHQIVLRFLEALGIDPETARADAEGMEHHVSEPTLAAFERFIAERKDSP
ncbi:MAG: mntR [Rhodospirillales bacterium]|nr:mntR [Rhodospirillales bacterium]